MDIVYYYDDVLGFCPVKKYLELNDFSCNKRLKLLAEIDQKINFIKENNGKPILPIAKPVHFYEFFEIKTRKNKNIVIRILYFCYMNKIVLLNVFEKPDNYKSNREKKKIIKHYEISQKYLNKFKLNNNNYEEYK